MCLRILYTDRVLSKNKIFSTPLRTFVEDLHQDLTWWGRRFERTCWDLLFVIFAFFNSLTSNILFGKCNECSHIKWKHWTFNRFAGAWWSFDTISKREGVWRNDVLSFLVLQLSFIVLAWPSAESFDPSSLGAKPRKQLWVLPCRQPPSCSSIPIPVGSVLSPSYWLLPVALATPGVLHNDWSFSYSVCLDALYSRWGVGEKDKEYPLFTVHCHCHHVLPRTPESFASRPVD